MFDSPKKTFLRNQASHKHFFLQIDYTEAQSAKLNILGQSHFRWTGTIADPINDPFNGPFSLVMLAAYRRTAVITHSIGFIHTTFLYILQTYSTMLHYLFLYFFLSNLWLWVPEQANYVVYFYRYKAPWSLSVKSFIAIKPLAAISLWAFWQCKMPLILYIPNLKIIIR